MNRHGRGTDSALRIRLQELNKSIVGLFTAMRGVPNSGVTSVTSSATSVTLKAANSKRKALAIYNGADTNLLVKYGADASATSLSIVIVPGGYVEVDSYTGIVDGIWEGSPTGSASITELTFS